MPIVLNASTTPTDVPEPPALALVEASLVASMASSDVRCHIDRTFGARGGERAAGGVGLRRAKNVVGRDDPVDREAVALRFRGRARSAVRDRYAAGVGGDDLAVVFGENPDAAHRAAGDIVGAAQRRAGLVGERRTVDRVEHEDRADRRSRRSRTCVSLLIEGGEARQVG